MESLDTKEMMMTSARLQSVMVASVCVLVTLSSPVLAEKTKKGQKIAAVTAIQKMGALIRPVSEDSGDYEVEFHIRGRGLDNAGLIHVANLGDVVSLNLRDTKITGAGLVHLKGLKKLRWLHLERTAVDDKGFENLAGLESLEYLNVYGTKITDKSLVHLKGLKKLRRLYIWQTGVTEAGADELRKALPKLEVVGGVDLAKIKALDLKAPPPPEIKEDLKFIVTSDKADAPRSQNGLNTTVFFVNKSGQPVKLYWVSYGGPLKLYHTLKPGEKKQQNSYSKNTWLVADMNDKVLGYFIIGVEVSRAVIPKSK